MDLQHCPNQVWWYIPVGSGFRRWRQSGQEFKATFSYEELRATQPSGHSVISKEISKVKGTDKNIFHIVKTLTKLRTEGIFD